MKLARVCVPAQAKHTVPMTLNLPSHKCSLVVPSVSQGQLAMAVLLAIFPLTFIAEETVFIGVHTIPYTIVCMCALNSARRE